tara:strand:- start:714 stop:1031 length:318 start_codon:yes stop_codon:yes gene_type:complete
MAAYYNISGELETEILNEDGMGMSKGISISNTHATASTHVDIYLGTLSKSGVASTSYYLKKNHLLTKGESLIIDSNYIPLNNTYGLFIKLTGVGTTSPTADIILS